MNYRDKVIELFINYKKNNEDKIYVKIADIINNEFYTNFDSEYIRSICRQYRRKYKLDENLNPIKDSVVNDSISFDINKDGTTTSNKLIRVKNMNNISADELLEIHGFNSSKFELVSARNSNCLTSNNKETYRSSIVVKPRKEFIWNQANLDNIISKLKIKPITTKYCKPLSSSRKALILPICDLHYGMRADLSTTGDEYNLDIAENSYNKVVSDIIYRTNNLGISKIYLTIGSDMLNCDNKQGSTTRGTPQSNDGEVESFIIGITNLLVNTIEYLRQYVEVELVYIPSNHDLIVSFGIANTLRMLYRECEDVKVDYSALHRKYKIFGNTLIGFAHKMSHKNVNDIIQSEARDMLSYTTNTVFLAQHYHHEQCIDKYGTDYRILPTISPNSRWAHENGYSSRKKVQSFILDEEYGITDILYSFVE